MLYISTCTKPMASKHGKVVTLREGRLPINSSNTLKHVLTRDHMSN